MHGSKNFYRILDAYPLAICLIHFFLLVSWIEYTLYFSDPLSEWLAILKEFVEKYLPCIVYFSILIYGEKNAKMDAFPYLMLAVTLVFTVITFTNGIYFKVGALKWQYTALVTHSLGAMIIYLATEDLTLTFYSVLFASAIYEAPWLLQDNKLHELLFLPKTTVAPAYILKKTKPAPRQILLSAAIIAAGYTLWLLPKTLPLLRITLRTPPYLALYLITKRTRRTVAIHHHPAG